MINKKAQVMENLGGLAIGIATFALVMVVAFLVIANTQTQTISIDPCADGYTINASGADCCITGTTCAGANASAYNSNAYNSTQDLQTAAATVPGWISLVVIVFIGAAILGMLGMFRRS